MSVKDVVVVGAGAAGLSAVDALRKEGYDGRLVLVGAEAALPYRRPALSKDVLRGDCAPEAIGLKPASWFEQAAVELVPGTAAVGVDPAARRVLLDDGRTLAWDRLVLATGGRARRLDRADGVLHLRSLDDVPALQQALRPGARVAVVGAGFVGAEIASTARYLGCDVVLVEAAPLPLTRLLPPVVARAYAGLHRRSGVDVRLNAAVHRADARSVVLSDGTRITADAVVVGIGMAPCTELAARAGCTLVDGPAGGVRVDADGATSVAGVFAAGDVAAAPDVRTGEHRRTEHWAAAQAGGTRVAHALLGRPAPEPEMPWSWSDQFGVNLQVCGWPHPSDDVVVRGDLDAADATVLLGAAGRLTGGITIGRPRQGRTLRALLARGASWDDVRDPGADLAALAAGHHEPAAARS